LRLIKLEKEKTGAKPVFILPSKKSFNSGWGIGSMRVRWNPGIWRETARF
jgi:hypothetical protein